MHHFGCLLLTKRSLSRLWRFLCSCVCSVTVKRLIDRKSCGAKSLGQQLDEQALLAGQLDFSVGSSFFGFAMLLAWHRCCK